MCKWIPYTRKNLAPPLFCAPAPSLAGKRIWRASWGFRLPPSTNGRMGRGRYQPSAAQKSSVRRAEKSAAKTSARMSRGISCARATEHQFTKPRSVSECGNIEETRMSTILMAQCWPLKKMTVAQKAVLISLADQANDEGVCWPGVKTISMRTCLSERAVQEALSWLQAV